MKRYRLKQARKDANLSTRQVGEAIGVTKAMITQLEHCRCNPSWEVALRLEQFFGIPASELLAETEAEDTVSKKDNN